MEAPAVTRFREYLRFKTVHPDPDYTECVAWIKRQAEEIGLEFHIQEFSGPDQFVVWLTWTGSDPELPSILLNSHMDVVPVDLEQWTYDPFGADKDESGNIYARGSQDMKSVGVAYLEAIRVLKARYFQPLRTVHISFVPDEEVGGMKGMGMWIHTPEFAKLNIGFALDEGIPTPHSEYWAFNAERTTWQFRITAIGIAGHGSVMFQNTAAEKIQYVINELLRVRSEQLELELEDPELNPGDVTSINLTMLEGGVQANVVPGELSVVFDMRITPSWDLEETENLILNICSEAGYDVTCNFLQKSKAGQVTSLGPENIWWKTLNGVMERMGHELKTGTFPAATDVRFLREKGISGLGFTPFNNTISLFHGHDEFLNENIFLEGISIYQQILAELTKIPKDEEKITPIT